MAKKPSIKPHSQMHWLNLVVCFLLVWYLTLHVVPFPQTPKICAGHWDLIEAKGFGLKTSCIELQPSSTLTPSYSPASFWQPDTLSVVVAGTRAMTACLAVVVGVLQCRGESRSNFCWVALPVWWQSAPLSLGNWKLLSFYEEGLVAWRGAEVIHGGSTLPPCTSILSKHQRPKGFAPVLCANSMEVLSWNPSILYMRRRKPDSQLKLCSLNPVLPEYTTSECSPSAQRFFGHSTQLSTDNRPVNFLKIKNIPCHSQLSFYFLKSNLLLHITKKFTWTK